MQKILSTVSNKSVHCTQFTCTYMYFFLLVVLLILKYFFGKKICKICITYSIFNIWPYSSICMIYVKFYKGIFFFLTQYLYFCSTWLLGYFFRTFTVIPYCDRYVLLVNVGYLSRLVFHNHLGTMQQPSPGRQQDVAWPSHTANTFPCYFFQVSFIFQRIYTMESNAA